jgi:hypothetical protein
MGTSIKKRKRIGKILVLLLASGSLLGISPLTATAAPPGDPTLDITVTVTDSTPPPDECIPDPASWSPVTTDINESLDLAFPPSLIPTFTVFLNFESGYDIGCDEDYPVTGTVVSTWVSTSDPLLSLTSLDCEFGCDAFLRAPAGVGGQIDGEYILPTEVGTATGTLTITWTPES